MARPRKYTDAQIIAALTKMKGMVYLAAQKLGCDPDTIYYRAKRSKGIDSAIKAERGKVLDTAEQKLFNAIQEGEAWAIRLALCTLGKNRGYVERQEIRSVSDGDIDREIESELAGVVRRRQGPAPGTAPLDPDDGLGAGGPASQSRPPVRGDEVAAGPVADGIPPQSAPPASATLLPPGGEVGGVGGEDVDALFDPP